MSARDLVTAGTAYESELDPALSDTGQPTLRITSDHGTWREVTRSPTNGRYRLVNGGTRPLWTIVEDAHDWWQRHGRPSW